MIKKLMTFLVLLPLSIALYAANVGICLGPKECSVAIYDPNQKTIAASPVPLIIYFPASGSPIVGYDKTLPYLKQDPSNCISNVMELLEQSGKTQKEIILRGKKYTVQDLLQIIFQYVRSRITSPIDEPVVVAIPTHLSYNQREIVRGAVFDAGLRPVRLVNMTTAAAIRYVNDTVKAGTVPSTIRVADALHQTISTFKFHDGILEEKEHKYHAKIDQKANFDEIIFSTRDTTSTSEFCTRIAFGAAAYAAMIDKAQVECTKVCLVTAVMPYSLHLKTPKGATRTIIAQNKPYPHTAPVIDYNITQPGTSLLIYQDKNESDIIGDLSIHGIKGKAHISFDIDRNGVLHAYETYKTNKDEEIQAASKSSRIFSQYSGSIKALSLETERRKCLEYIKNTEDAYFANTQVQKKLWFWQRGIIRGTFYGLRSLAKSAKSIEKIQEVNDMIFELRLGLRITIE